MNSLVNLLFVASLLLLSACAQRYVYSETPGIHILPAPVQMELDERFAHQKAMVPFVISTDVSHIPSSQDNHVHLKPKNIPLKVYLQSLPNALPTRTVLKSSFPCPDYSIVPYPVISLGDIMPKEVWHAISRINFSGTNYSVRDFHPILKDTIASFKLISQKNSKTYEIVLERISASLFIAAKDDTYEDDEQRFFIAPFLQYLTEQMKKQCLL